MVLMLIDVEALDRLAPTGESSPNGARIDPGAHTGGRDGRWYIARFLPYRTPEDLICGVVLTFVDITERKKAEGEHARLHAAVAGAQEHLRLIFENTREYAFFRRAGPC